MDILVGILFVLNFFLAWAWIVALMARMDRRYAKQVRDREEYKSHFRRDRH
ncbi:MAG: hypothetical protein AAFP85_12165 [Pseudomonadota bacterium]